MTKHLCDLRSISDSWLGSNFFSDYEAPFLRLQGPKFVLREGNGQRQVDPSCSETLLARVSMFTIVAQGITLSKVGWFLLSLQRKGPAGSGTFSRQVEEASLPMR